MKLYDVVLVLFDKAFYNMKLKRVLKKIHPYLEFITCFMYLLHNYTMLICDTPYRLRPQKASIYFLLRFFLIILVSSVKKVIVGVEKVNLFYV